MLQSVIALMLLAAPMPSPAAETPARSANAEMTAIFDADQNARKSPTIDWAVVSPQDESRRKRTQALLDAGALQSGDDFFHAAFVFQHGGSSDDYLKAHLLATIAVARGDADATWIAAATLDRYLQTIGKPQILGTQFHVGEDGRATQEPYDRALASDALRKALGVPPLVEQEARRKTYERTALLPPPSVAQPALQQLAPAPPARAFAAKLQPAQCDPIPGAEALLERADLKWIVVGEMHGTTETPRTFGDLVCLASASRPVAVAVEQTTSEQPAIDAFIGSDGGAEATSRFLASRIWTQSVKDGRSSQAYFALFQRLRALRAAGRITSVVAFQPVYSPGPGGFQAGDYENALASSLISRVAHDERILVLVGNLHARRTSPAWAKPPYLPMAGYLPVAISINLDTKENGGSYWACKPDMTCGPQSAAVPPIALARGITKDAAGPYAGALNLGVAATASPPQGPSVAMQDPR